MTTGSEHGASVSVVVPTHNRPKLVVEAVRAIMDQDHEGPVQVLVVFDNSTPHPIEVTCPPGRSLRILVNDARTPGLAGARNTGILAADSAYVAFCDDDDAWLPGKLSAQMAALRAHGADAVVATGVLVETDRGAYPRPGPTRTLGQDDFLRDRIMEIHPSTLLFRRDTLTDVIGLVDEDVPGSYGEDYELLLRATRTVPVINVAQPLVRVGFHAGSCYASRWQTIIAGLRYLLERYPEFAHVPRGLARIHGQIAFAHAALGARRDARRSAWAALRGNGLEKRAYAALLVSIGFPSDWVATLARSRGRGI